MILKNKEFKYLEQLTSEQKAKLKGMAHHLKPVMQIGGGGFSDGVIKELSLVLDKHELVKIQLPPDTNAQSKEEMLDGLKAILPKHALFVSRIGRTVILYQQKKPDDQKVKI